MITTGICCATNTKHKVHIVICFCERIVLIEPSFTIQDCLWSNLISRPWRCCVRTTPWMIIHVCLPIHLLSIHIDPNRLWRERNRGRNLIVASNNLAHYTTCQQCHLQGCFTLRKGYFRSRSHLYATCRWLCTIRCINKFSSRMGRHGS